jgi:hypothetical protein
MPRWTKTKMTLPCKKTPTLINGPLAIYRGQRSPRCRPSDTSLLDNQSVRQRPPAYRSICPGVAKAHTGPSMPEVRTLAPQW